MTFVGDNVIVTPYLEARKSLLATFAKEDSLLPCWSTGSLLELLKTRKYCNFITLHSSHSLKWILTTSYYELANWKEKETIGETQIEAVYNMVVWLLENGCF